MLEYRIRGPILEVLAPTEDLSLAPAALSVLVDGEDTTPFFAPYVTDDGWEIGIPLELYDGQPHRIVIRTIAEGQEVERVTFSFAGSCDVLSFN